MEVRVYKKYDTEIKYLIDFPENYDKSKKYPLMFYIHGFGFVGKDMDYLKERCPLQRSRVPKDLPFILVVPQCPVNSWLFISQTLQSFIRDISKSDFCNSQKVYLSGSSMGGYACWLLVQSMPDFFAGAVICCGAGQYWATVTKAFNNTPIMAVHGKQDTTVLPRESEIMAERINESGGSVVLTLLDNGHDVWTDIFTDSKTYYWLDGKMLNSH